MKEEQLDLIRTTIKETVNGKIDALKKLVEDHNTAHELDMIQVRAHIAAVSPIIVEYQQRVAAQAFARRIGDTVKWTAGVVTAAGVIWALFFKN